MHVKNNIQDFNECAAFVLNKLYDNFPVPSEIDCWNLQDKDDPERTLAIVDDTHSSKPNPKKNGLFVVEEVDEIELQLDRYKWAVHFLIKEGFIRDLKSEWIEQLQQTRSNAQLNRQGSHSFEKLVLTAKGLSILDAVPDSISSTKPMTRIEKIKAALGAHSGEAIREVITGVVSASASMA